MNQVKGYIPSLNGLRALSILFVILGHLKYRTFGDPAVPFPLDILFNASLGVNVFFVISGFLITRLLLLEEKINGDISLRNFYARRVIRIFPAYYFVLLVYLVLELFSVLHFTRSSWFSSLFYYKYLNNGAYDDWESGHFWSLSVEEHFYLIWPFVFSFFKKQRVYFSYFIILLVVFFRFNVYYHFWGNKSITDPLSIFLRGDALMVGCLIALYENKLTTWVLKYRKSWASVPLLLFLLIVVSADFLNQWNFKYHLHLGVLMIPLGLGSPIGLVTNSIIGFLILSSINIKGIWYHFLNFRWMEYIGKLSYSLYLWQELFFSTHIGRFSKFPINLVCIFLVANFSFYFIEKPFLKLKGKFSIGQNTNPKALAV